MMMNGMMGCLEVGRGWNKVCGSVVLMDMGASVLPRNLMTRKLFALLVLATFGLLAGPHPCNAAEAERESGKPSCHEAAEFPRNPQLDADSSSPPGAEDCCDIACRHACHMVAVAEAVPFRSRIAPVADAVAEVAGCGLVLFAHPIDHVPLG